jgi:serine/threonine protein phosphatase PrpC
MVADGHGRDTGQIASQTCVESLKRFVDENMELLKTNPVSFLENYYKIAHQHVREAFVKFVENNEHEVKVDSDGVITSRRSEFSQFKHLMGGATLSVIIFINDILYTSNVGDSAGLLFSNKPNLQKSMIKYEKDAAVEGLFKTFTNTEPRQELVLTAEHSPESSDEYIRIRNFRQSEADKNHAELLFVYDVIEREKPLCPRIFDISEDGTPNKAEVEGYYIKNVQGERATYVTVPFSAGYPDAVAFTRSIGDFNITTYGVSEKPEIHSIHMNDLFMRDRAARNADRPTGGDSDATIPIFCLVLATDGIWDNWTPEIARKFVMDPSCLNAIKTNPSEGAQKVSKSFGVRNLYYANKNFGRNKDDQTNIIVYITEH